MWVDRRLGVLFSLLLVGCAGVGVTPAGTPTTAPGLSASPAATPTVAAPMAAAPAPNADGSPVKIEAQPDTMSATPGLVAAGGLYDMGLPRSASPVDGRPNGGSVSIKVTDAGWYRFTLPADVPMQLSAVDVNADIYGNPQPSLETLPAGERVTYRADLRVGWYFLSFGPTAQARTSLAVSRE